jgi:hypothetical protein
MITPRQGFLACAVDGKIYAISGENSRSSGGDATRLVEMYDPQTDTWQRKTPRPMQRTFFAGCAIDGVIYNFGGGAIINEGAFAECYTYSVAADSWERKRSMPSARSLLAACACDGYAYVIGGAIRSTVIPKTENERYDPATDTWVSLSETYCGPIRRGGLGCSVEPLFLAPHISGKRSERFVIKCHKNHKKHLRLFN